MFTSYSKLAVAIIVYYVIGLPIATYVLIKQGLGRQASWIYLLSLALVRIAGAALTIAYNEKPSAGLAQAALILSSIGLAPLVLALLGVLKRTNDGIHTGKPLQEIPFRLIHLLTLIGIILAIVAGTKATSTDPSTLSTATSLRKGGAACLLIAVLLTAGIALFMCFKLPHIQRSDRTLVFVSAAAAPFLVVRVIYTMLTGFSHDPKFNPFTPNVYIQAFMQILMEFIVFALLLLGGLMVERMDESKYHNKGIGQMFGSKHADQGRNYNAREVDLETRGQAPGQQNGYHASRR